jgi:hypothetical protein
MMVGWNILDQLRVNSASNNEEDKRVPSIVAKATSNKDG